MTEAPHRPVMVEEVVQLLAGADVVVDMTLGAGGHAEALLDAGVAEIVGVDRDPEALAIATERLRRFGDRVRVVQSRFSEVDEDDVGGAADGMLFDLGVSSMQLDEPARGFSFRQDATARHADGRASAGRARPPTSSTGCPKRSSRT